MRSALYETGRSRPVAPTSFALSQTSSMSDSVPTETAAIRELEQLVRHLADELAGFRRRAFVAEARLKEIEAHEGGAANLDLLARVSQLEQQNDRLRAKL